MARVPGACDVDGRHPTGPTDPGNRRDQGRGVRATPHGVPQTGQFSGVDDVEVDVDQQWPGGQYGLVDRFHRSLPFDLTVVC